MADEDDDTDDINPDDFIFFNPSGSGRPSLDPWGVTRKESVDEPVYYTQEGVWGADPTPPKVSKDHWTSRMLPSRTTKPQKDTPTTYPPSAELNGDDAGAGTGRVSSSFFGGMKHRITGHGNDAGEEMGEGGRPSEGFFDDFEGEVKDFPADLPVRAASMARSSRTMSRSRADTYSQQSTRGRADTLTRFFRVEDSDNMPSVGGVFSMSSQQVC
jgi:hypothetical protein